MMVVHLISHRAIISIERYKGKEWSCMVLFQLFFGILEVAVCRLDTRLSIVPSC